MIIYLVLLLIAYNHHACIPQGIIVITILIKLTVCTALHICVDVNMAGVKQLLPDICVGCGTNMFCYDQRESIEQYFIMTNRKYIARTSCK